MMARLVTILILCVVLVWGIGAYLAPDDLADCPRVGEVSDTACSAAGAIVVISGGDTIARTNEAIKLYNEGWAPVIVFSGAAADKNGPSNAKVMREHAVQKGVPESATIAEEASETTKQNAAQVKSHLQSNGINDVILVTSGYHMRRAGLEFERELGDTIGLRRHPVKSDSQWSPLWFFTPWGWNLALGELLRIALFYIGASR